jgi:hypothetical protein
VRNPSLLPSCVTKSARSKASAGLLEPHIAGGGHYLRGTSPVLTLASWDIAVKHLLTRFASSLESR